ncbi:MAG: hypothetical protein HY854_09620 [Burkholderiales bacterium]|nr:hypothetical protein [Burkholderiales bacterium]
MFVVGLLSSLVAAPLLHAMGWQSLNLVLLPWLAAVALALSALGWARARLSLRA